MDVVSVQLELEKILESGLFRRSKHLSEFLRFVVERKCQGRESEIKEIVIGSEGLRRGNDFDPMSNSIVRVQAHKLRRKLTQYYQGLGKNDTVRIIVPTGSYIPRFHYPESPSQPCSCSPYRGDDIQTCITDIFTVRRFHRRVARASLAYRLNR